jgi:hypothetical protein
MKRSSIRNILVATDFSKISIEAIKTAKRLAGRFAAAIEATKFRESHLS